LTINIDIISGFLGAGKTTFLKKVIPAMKGKIVLIENEFGDVGVDGDLLHDKLPIREIYAGCICCSLVQDFKKAIEELALQYTPDHILIEPSGVGSLSDIIKVCTKISGNSNFDIRINHLITIVDVSAFTDYLENFGGFYLDQIKNANIIFLSHLDKLNHSEIEKVVSIIRLNNQTAVIFKDDWYSYAGEEIIDILDTVNSCENGSKGNSIIVPANKIFNTFSILSPRSFQEKDMDKIAVLLNSMEYGDILRAKGMLQLDSKKFVYFDFTPHHYHWEYLGECKGTKVAFIGSNLRIQKILDYFHE
jgi:G3E family GTPase